MIIINIAILVIFVILIFSIFSLYNNLFDSFDNNEKYYRNNFACKNSTLILYWATWCGHCTKIKPDWENAKKNIKIKYPDLNINEIECDNPDKCFTLKNDKKEMIQGVPTIILRNNTTDIEYVRDSERNIICNKKSDDLIRFLDLYLEK